MRISKNLNWRKTLKYIGFLCLLIGLGLSLCINIHLRQYREGPYPKTFLPQWIPLYDDLKFVELTNKLPDSYDEMLGLINKCDDQLESIIYYNLSFADLVNMEIDKCLANLQLALERNPDNEEARWNLELLMRQRSQDSSDDAGEGEGEAKLFREEEKNQQGKYSVGGASVGW